MWISLTNDKVPAYWDKYLRLPFNKITDDRGQCIQGVPKLLCVHGDDVYECVIVHLFYI